MANSVKLAGMRSLLDIGVVVVLQALQVLQCSAEAALVLEPATGQQQRVAWRGRDLAASVVRHTQRRLNEGFKGSGPPRSLKDTKDYASVHGSTTKTGVSHNGTHFVSHVDAKWKCVFPDGTCFHDHAPLEGLPDEMDKCITEKNIQPLIIEMNIDLNCIFDGPSGTAMDSMIHCDASLRKEPFDPFHTCTNDPNLVKATCHFDCKSGHPHQICTFELDSIGAFNMSDVTIEACSMYNECSSPYVENHQMWCSTHKAQGEFKPHWQSRPLPKRGSVDNGLRAPPPQPKTEGPSLFLGSLWAVALLAMVLGVFVMLMRLGIVPEPERLHELWLTFTEGTLFASKRRVPRYRAPPVGGEGGQYVAPSGPVTSGGAVAARDHELETLSG